MRPPVADLHQLADSAVTLGLSSFSADPLPPGAVESPPSRRLDPAVPGGAASPEVTLIREKLRHIRDRAQLAGLITSESAPAANTTPPEGTGVAQALRPPLPVEPFPSRVDREAATTKTVTSSAGGMTQGTGQTMAERLADFATWAARSTTAEEMLLLNEHGDLLWGNPTRDDLVPSTMLAVNAAARAAIGSPAQTIPMLRTKAGAGTELNILCCSTSQGPVILALVNSKSAAEDVLRETLIQAIEK